MKNTTTTDVEQGYIIHLDTLTRPYIVPRYVRTKTTEKISVFESNNAERELLTLFVIYCLVQKTWAVPVADARRLFFMNPEEYKSSCQPAAMNKFLKLRLLEESNLKIIATPALQKTVFLTLKEAATEHDVRYTFEPMHVIGERGLAGNCKHLHGRMYYYPAEALEAYIRFAPIWKMSKKHHAAKVRYGSIALDKLIKIDQYNQKSV